jgi:hypothetical protein
MSAFYDLASVVLVPSGYKSGKIYAQKPLTTDGQLTFTRASTATRVNASGLIESVASGVPRLDYLGSTCPKLLLEPQRTNIATQSNDYSSFVKSSDTGITLNSATSPDGTNNATLVYCINTTTNAFIAQGFSGSSSTLYTVSFYAKKKELDLVYLKNVNDTGGQSFFNLTTGVATLVSGLDSVTMTAVGNGWYRCIAKSTSASTNVQWIPIVRGNANQGLYIYGLQIEAGAYETSLIPTSGAAVTRLADAASKTGISSLLNSTQGTIFLEVERVGPSGASTENLLFISDTSTNNFVNIVFDPSTARYRGQVRANGTTTGLAVAAAAYTGTFKIAIAYAANDLVLYINGVQQAVDTSVTIPSVAFNSLGLGGVFDGTYFDTFRGNYSQALLFKTRLTNAQLAELTTL